MWEGLVDTADVVLLVEVEESVAAAAAAAAELEEEGTAELALLVSGQVAESTRPSGGQLAWVLEDIDLEVALEG